MSDKIMITGSRGFIGSTLTKYFDNPIEYDIALDRGMSVLNEHALSLFMDKVEPNIIIHLAGNPFAPKSVEDPDRKSTRQNSSHQSEARMPSSA